MKGHAKQQQDYLSFTRKERTGIICVVIMMILFPFIPALIKGLSRDEIIDHQAFQKEIALLRMQETDSSKAFGNRHYTGYKHDYQATGNGYYNTNKGELFYFDPNNTSVEDWKKLGIREKTANTIHNYISKGGHFYKPDDISKIWGLHEDEVKRLLPYVRIGEKPSPGYSRYPDPGDNKIYSKHTYNIVPCDVNSSDTAAFIALPGIGSKLAARIVAFREKLGGFYKIEQVAETYGLPDSTFQKIKSRLVIGSRDVKKLDINKATVDELKTHPYIRYQLANAIVQYRTQHGNFASLEDIKKILLVTDDMYGKIAPYITIK